MIEALEARILAFVTPPTAHLVSPGADSLAAITSLNAHQYIDVQYLTSPGTSLNIHSVLDPAPEFTLSGSAASSVKLNGKPKPLKGQNFRYHFAGRFRIGEVTVSFIANSWADNTGVENAAATEQFTVATNDLRFKATRPGGKTTTVEIRRNDGGLIDPSATSWIIIHGRSDSPASPAIATLTASVAADRPGEQILTLDWHRAAAAHSFVDFSGQEWIGPVGLAAGAALSGYGFSGSQLNLIGHSWGAYVAANLAQRIGGVDSIVALDPALYVPLANGTYDTDTVNFAAVSHNSWAFRASLYGSPVTPMTAATAVEANAGTFASTITHTNVVYLFADMLNIGVQNPADPAAQIFSLDRLTADTTPPWLPRQFQDVHDPMLKYDAIVDADSSGVKLQDVKYVSDSTASLVVVT